MKTPLKKLLAGDPSTVARDIGLLALRLGFGLSMALAHGLGKLKSGLEHGFGNMERGDQIAPFQDPLGLMSDAMAHICAAGAEFFCSLLVAIGLLTRVTAILVVFTMVVAFFVVHGEDPFQRKELALMYMLGFSSLVFLGPGRVSVDHLLSKKIGPKAP